MQATNKHTAPFLTTTRTLTNNERLWQWQRRKQDKQDRQADDQLYLGWCIVAGALGACILGFIQFLAPCLLVWTSAGIHCL